MKRCTKCDCDKPLGRFAVDRAKRDGRDSWCRDCRNEARRERYGRNHEHEVQRSANYYSAHREEQLAARRRYYQDHIEEARAASRRYWQTRTKTGARAPEQERINYMKRHGGIDEWARLYEAQDGLCYLCGETMEGTPRRLIAVDHDHDCCPGSKADTRSCAACRRGLTHAWCNQIIGMVGEDMNVLRAIVANFERVSPHTKRRIAAKQQQGELDLDLAI